MAINDKLQSGGQLYPLTPLQQVILFHHTSAPEAGLYLNRQQYLLEGEVNASALKSACEQVVERHEALRTAMTAERSQGFQQILPDVRLAWQVLDWTSLSTSDQDIQMRKFLGADWNQGFDLHAPPLFRICLIRLSPNRFHFVWTHHLIALDGWSTAIIFAEIMAIYEAIVSRRTTSLAPAPSYRSYLEWLQTQDLRRAERYWQTTLSGFTAAAQLTDAPITLPASQADFAEQQILLESKLTTTLQLFSRKHHLTLNTVVLGAWAVLLARHTGQDDVLFGSVTSMRPPHIPGVEMMVGLFVNTVPVRIKLPLDGTLVEWLGAVQLEQATARSYQFTPVAESRQWNSASRTHGLFETVVIFQNFPLAAGLGSRTSGFTIENISSTERSAAPLTLTIVLGSQLLVRLVYDRRLFVNREPKELIERFRSILEDFSNNPNKPVLLSSGVSADDKKHLVANFNRRLVSEQALGSTNDTKHPLDLVV